MLFLLRCAFWLGLVFSALPWSGGTNPVAPLKLAEAAQTVARKAAATAATQCSATPLECLEAAGKLNRLFEIVAAAGDGQETNSVSPGTLNLIDRLPAWQGGPAK